VVNEEGIVSQQNAYYPFGMRMAMANSLGDASQKYLYNGKEKQDETEWLDYGARMYDAGLGRFMTVDPLAERYHFQTPFAYATNDPIKYIDKNGEMPQWIVGAVVGAAVDYGLQVVGNVATGGLNLSAFTDINGGSIV